MLDLDNEELALAHTSLSITYDAYSKKLERLTGPRYQDTLDDIDVCNRVLGKLKDEQMRRYRDRV